MSRIYEAIELTGVELDQDRSRDRNVTPTFRTVPAPSTPFEEKLLALHRKIDALVDSPTGTLVGVVGLQKGGQGFTYARELAQIGAARLNKRVLLVGTSYSGAVRSLLARSVSPGWDETAANDRPIADAVQHVDDLPFAISQMNASRDSLGSLIGSRRFDSLIRQARDHFDLVLVDTPSLAEAMDAIVLAPFMDGTVVIVDAGVSRWQVVRHAVDEIHAHQGRVLGVVLNKRRHFIPDYIYRKL